MRWRRDDENDQGLLVNQVVRIRAAFHSVYGGKPLNQEEKLPRVSQHG